MSITRCRLPQNPSRIINTKLHFCSYDIFRLLYVCRNLITACFLCLVFFYFLLHFTLISPLSTYVKQENLHSQIRVQVILRMIFETYYSFRENSNDINISLSKNWHGKLVVTSKMIYKYLSRQSDQTCIFFVAVLSNILYCFNHSYEICAVENEACFIAFNKVYKITTTLVDIYNLIISLIN